MPAFLERSPPSRWHALNPLTKLIFATVTAMVVLIIGGLVGPLILVAVAVVLPASVAGVLGRLVRTSLLVSLPIAISTLLINVFFFPGGQEVLLRLGPVVATREGVGFAFEILARILTISGAITLFYLTTRPSELVLDLERRGVSPRVAFVANASVQTVPAMLERASNIVAAQRARGLDTEGSLVRRIRGLLPVVAPVVLGSIVEVEERTLALEARGFTRPGRRALLWFPGDSAGQRAARWLLVSAVPVAALAAAYGLLAWLP
ncbi:hypothetical protein BH18CHL1_BH18CHL1_00440 [soil metagenome]